MIGKAAAFSARVVMSIAIRILVLVLAWLGLLAPAFPQTPTDGNDKIQFNYVPPKSLRYVATAERLRQFQFLEQLSQFFSPLRLPHNFSMVTIECGLHQRTVRAFTATH